MTMIVGVVGTDGIALAADQKVIAPASDEGVMDDTYGICKIIDLPEYRIAYACAGDVVTANVGNALEERLRTGDDKFAVTAESLQDLAKKTWAGMERKYVVNPINRVMLVVVYGEEPQLWRLNVLGPESHAIKVETIAVAGALGNTARFFAEYYQPERTADQLTFLAAHIVLTGSRIDHSYVDGLDVATFTVGRCDFLNRQQTVELKRKSTALDEMIRRELFG